MGNGTLIPAAHRPLQIALVGGPMYDHLYELFSPEEVEIVVHADHPTLNRTVAGLLDGGERIDLLATHSKYAPSQARWLRPLDDLVDPATLEDLAPRAVELCRFGGTLLSLPRLIDVRVLWARTDRIIHVPRTWDEMLASGTAFGFPGRESGLFGTFFEIVVGLGGRLFDDEIQPTFATAEAEQAIDMLCRLAAAGPQDLPSWHYDDVDAALLAGRVDAAGAWPGAWATIRGAAEAGLVEPHPYPSGARRWVTYAGCHSWAVPTTCGDIDGALALLHRLAGADAQAHDAGGGSICAHQGALAAVVPENAVDHQRRDIIRRSIDEAMITYPSLTRFPEIEDAGWTTIHDAIRGITTPTRAAALIQAAALHVLSDRPVR